MLLLCLSDIHGHLDALAAVLATAERRSFHKLLIAGDIVFPGPKPLETWRRLTAAGAILVQGVSDKALATLDPDELPVRNEHEKSRIDRLRTVQEELGELILERLKRLPTHVRIPLEDGRDPRDQRGERRRGAERRRARGARDVDRVAAVGARGRADRRPARLGAARARRLARLAGFGSARAPNDRRRRRLTTSDDKPRQPTVAIGSARKSGARKPLH